MTEIGASRLSVSLAACGAVLLLMVVVPLALRPTREIPAPATPRVLLTRDLYVPGYERPHPELCPALGMGVKVLILVSSAPAHESARDAVRLTWGQFAQRSEWAMAFVLGVPADALRPALGREDALYGDIIIGRSLDSYSNLTLKVLSMLEWVETYCPRAPLLLKTDDDMFINVPLLMNFVATTASVRVTRTIWGQIMTGLRPGRDPSSKDYISQTQFPGAVLPNFTSGGTYLLTTDATRALLAAAGPEPYISTEDVFVTGVLTRSARVRLINVPAFCVFPSYRPACAVRRCIAVLLERDTNQLEMWSHLLKVSLLPDGLKFVLGKC